MEVVVGTHAGQSQWLGDAGEFSECGVITPDRTIIQVRSSGYDRAGIGRSSWKGLSTGRHEKAPVPCPCIRLAALHRAPRTVDRGRLRWLATSACQSTKAYCYLLPISNRQIVCGSNNGVYGCTC